MAVYDARDGRGNYVYVEVGEYRNNRNEFGQMRNDSAYSVSVPQGYQIRFCEKEGRNGQGDGKCEEYGPGNHNLRYPGTASYIRVWGTTPQTGGGGGGWQEGNWQGGARGITVYDDRDYRGTAQSFPVGRFLAGAGQFGSLRNDEASSVVVMPGFRVRLCENEGNDARGSGRCEEYGEGRYNLRYNDEASYIEVRRAGGGWGNPGGGWGNNPGGGWGNNPGGGWGGTGDPVNAPVVVYSDKNQGGAEQVFGPGNYRFDLGNFGNLRNDDASSVYVSRGFRVRFCEGEGSGNGTGRCEEWGYGFHNLRYNDTHSYIRVWRSNY